MFWWLLLGSRLGFRWWSPGSPGVYPAVPLGGLLGPAPTSPGCHYGVAWTAFDYATSTSHCVSRWAIFSSSESHAVFCCDTVAIIQTSQTGWPKERSRLAVQPIGIVIFYQKFTGKWRTWEATIVKYSFLLSIPYLNASLQKRSCG